MPQMLSQSQRVLTDKAGWFCNHAKQLRNFFAVRRRVIFLRGANGVTVAGAEGEVMPVAAQLMQQEGFWVRPDLFPVEVLSPPGDSVPDKSGAQQEQAPKAAHADPRERHLKIEEDGDFCKGLTFPKIRLRGQWLERAGFPPGQRVLVTRLAPGVLELRSYDALPLEATDAPLPLPPNCPF